MKRLDLMRRMSAALACTITVVGGLSTPSAAQTPVAPTPAAVKPVPAQPPDAWHLGAGPRVTAKPKRAAGAAPTPLAAWSVTIGASSTSLWPLHYATITATTNQDVGPTPYWITIAQVMSGSGQGWTAIAVCGSGTICSASVTRPDPGYGSYIAYVADYPAVVPPSGIQAFAPAASTYQVQWRGVGLGLGANLNTVGVGAQVTLVASAGEDVGPSPFYIQIYEQETGTRVAVCGYGTSCTATVSQTAAVVRTYGAVVAPYSTAWPPPGVISWSAATYVTWTFSPFRVWLSGLSRTSNARVTLTANTNLDVGPTPYYIRIFNQATGALVGSCGAGTACTFDVPVVLGWNSDVALVSAAGAPFLPPDIQATSNSIHTERVRLT